MGGLVVVTATDRHYVELVGIMLMSLAEHARESVEAVHVFGTNLSGEDRRRLMACYPEPGALHIHELDGSTCALLDRLKVRTHITPSCYVRLLIPQLLPEVRQRMLYVDCDVVINGDLAPLAGLDMQSHAVAAVTDGRAGAHAQWNRRIGVPENTPYLNSGVLLIDPELWRARGITEKCTAFALNGPEKLHLLDQDALNATLAGDWLPLERTWNFYESSFVSRQSTDASGFLGARIIHFVGRTKPNHADCVHPATPLYRSYRARSPWAQARLHDPVARNIRVYVSEAARQLARAVRRRFKSGVSLDPGT